MKRISANDLPDEVVVLVAPAVWREIVSELADNAPAHIVP
jgi:hypothetical protein